MLSTFCALNESSYIDSEGETSEGSSKGEESLEFRDDDYLTLYNRALLCYGEGNFELAENEFRDLTTHAYFASCGFHSQKPRPIAIKLQFNSHRYLGLCLSRKESFSEALTELEKALDIDDSDPTLHFKFAVIAVKAGQLLRARNALEHSFRLNDKQGFRTIRHWPSLDLVISITYKLDDCISCLRYIELALANDPNYEKGHRLKDQIYEEYPFLHPDPEVQKRPMVPRPVVEIQQLVEAKQPPPPKVLKVDKKSISQLIACVVAEYNSGGNGRMKDLLEPCTVEFESSPSTIEENEVDMKDVSDVMNEILDKIEEAEEQMITDNDDVALLPVPTLTESEEIVAPIADGIILDAINYGFMEQIILKAADFAVGESYANSMSKRCSKGAAASFLNEVPMDLVEKRRSSRMRGVGGRAGVDSNSESMLECPRGDDMTARALIESLFPPSLLRQKGDDNVTSTPVKKSVAKSPVKSESRQPPMEVSWLASEEEEQLAGELIESCMTDTCLNSCLSDLLLRVTAELGQTCYHWPRSFDQLYLELYMCWRPHFIPPEECVPQDPHEFLQPMLVANEIIMRDLAAVSFYEAEDEAVVSQVEKLNEFLWDDLQHLVLNIFRVSRPMAVRILSLHMHYYKFKGKVLEASGIADRMKPFLDAVDAQELKSPILDCEIFRKEKVDAFIETQRNRQLISRVNQLYEEQEYRLVKDVLLANLEVANCSKAPVLTGTRLFHLLMMVDALWHLNDYESSMAWIEQAVHEILTCHHDDLEPYQSDLLNLLKSLECCFVMLDGDLSSLEERPRLASNLLRLVLSQVDGKEDCDLGENTILPWVLLYHLIAHDEKSMEEFEDDVPCSVNFLCSAHDYLGPLSLCTLEGGKLLTLLVKGIVDVLFKGVSHKGTSDQLCKSVEQALFCLYAHPSKKSKARHLVDHSVSNVAFTWDRSLHPYLYLRPKKLPEYDDLKSASISSETVVFFRRIVALVPDRFRIAKRTSLMKKYLSHADFKFPTFDNRMLTAKEGDDEDSVIAEADDDHREPFPVEMLDLFYLLADYYFKNSEFEQAVEFYMVDLSWNKKRIDSWVPLTLSLVNGLETKINEMNGENNGKAAELNNDTVKLILSTSNAIMKCFRKCIKLSGRSTTIRIESGNFAYMMHSFCVRQVSEENVENLSMELFTLIDEIKPKFMAFAEENYDAALRITEEKATDGTMEEEESNEHDERWLLYMMKGKLFEKRKKPLVASLELYFRAIENLVAQGAAVPKRINFNSPPEHALELIEVYYRIHASVLKLELRADDTFQPPADELRKIWEMLTSLDNVARVVFDGKQPAQTAETNNALGDSDPPPAKKPKIDGVPNPDEDSSASLWNGIAKACLKALETVTHRFSAHFKAVHLLGQYHLKSRRHKDLRKARKYLWGNEVVAPSAKVNYNSVCLFGDRKANNLFNGIWRMPLSEIDRAGSFSTHMSKCVGTVLDLATELNDPSMLTDISILLRKPPSNDQKYLFESQRRSFSKQAYALMRQIIKTKAEMCVRSKPKESQVAVLLEVHQIFSRLRKVGGGQSRDEALMGHMVDLYKSISANASASFDEVNAYCNRMTSADHRPSKAGSSGTVSSLLKNSNRTSSGASQSSPSSSSANVASSSSAALAALGISDATSVKAAIDYVNAASYYNELVTMMAGGNAGGSGKSSYTAEAQAYLSAYAAAATASYTSLLTSLPSTISVTKSEKKAQSSSSPASLSSSSRSGACPPSKQSSPVPKKKASVTVTASKSSGIKTSTPLLPPSVSLTKTTKVLMAKAETKKPAQAQVIKAKQNPALLSGITLSKVIVSEVGKKEQPSAKRISTSITRVPTTSGISSSVSAAAVASANDLLMRERAKLSGAKSQRPATTTTTIEITPSTSKSAAQEALDKLKSFRSSLPGALKKVAPPPPPPKRPRPHSAQFSNAAMPPADPTMIHVDDDDDDVICID